MSSDEEDYNDQDDNSPIQDPQDRSKKRKVQRACDVCRRKKIRCDGGQMVAGSKCTNCVAYNFDCTYQEAAKKRGPPKGYVESLETRLEKMEKLLQRLCPDADFTKELGASIDKDKWMAEAAGGGASKRAGSSKKGGDTAACKQHKPGYNDEPLEDGLVPSDDERMLVRLTDPPKNQVPPVIEKRFHGKSSGVMLVHAAVDFKREFAGKEIFRDNMPSSRRTEFWTLPSYEFRHERAEERQFKFALPADDLLKTLIETFFHRVNLYHPLLHRGLFDQQLASGLQNDDNHFMAIVLLVCACASRFVDDDRVMLEPGETHSSGWKYFEQVEPFRRLKTSAPRLFDLQIQVLSIIFLSGTSSPHAAWTIVGIGIRMAQDVGAHRNKVYKDKPNLVDELWKRAFWTLVSLDRLTSSSFGRPCAIQDEDFDLDLPLEVDDDCWDLAAADSNYPLKNQQPATRPSDVSFFVCHMKLSQILAFALRTIYSINKSKILLGFVGPQWEQHIVAELDSALNKWIDSVPDHLRWDPNREELKWFNQSATLYTAYYHLQILIHRPFIPSPKKPSPLSFPSLAICTNAARSCSHVLDIQLKRDDIVQPWQIATAFTSGIVLLLNIWGVKKSATSPDAASQMADVHKCMNVLTSVEKRWHAAGRLWDIVCELASVRDFPLPNPAPRASNKREREEETASETSPGETPGSGGMAQDRPIAKGRGLRPQQRQQATAGGPGMDSMASNSGGPPAGFMGGLSGFDPMFPNGLPMGTNELAQAPIDPMYNQYFGHSGFTPESVNWLPVEAQALMSADTAPLISHVNFPDPFMTGLGMGGASGQTDPLLASLGAAQGATMGGGIPFSGPQMGMGMGMGGAESLFGPPVPGHVPGPGQAGAPMQPMQPGNPQGGPTIDNLQVDGMAMWSTPPGWNWADWANLVGTNQPDQQQQQQQVPQQVPPQSGTSHGGL
ncbi:fungal-specific transcription factor domain-containing protein [Auriculariales sp. MPI-PUGE-AT-0066]|nr:fungal-specific transcription factor domain-containing protein [Auriculariales sp. MPI-PUGE-AT-0066]